MITYPYLPKGRIIRYVPENNLFMLEAKRARDNLSTESKQPTGAVIVLNNKIIARGANQARVKNKYLRRLHQKCCLRKLFGIPTGTHYWVCPGCAHPSDHAESSAINDAILRDVATTGADIYLYGHWWCCKPCWDRMVYAGIRDVYLLSGSERSFNKNHSKNIVSRHL